MRCARNEIPTGGANTARHKAAAPGDASFWVTSIVELRGRNVPQSLMFPSHRPLLEGDPSVIALGALTHTSHQEAGQIVAALLMRVTGEHVEILSIAVRADGRRRGIGTALLKAGLSAAGRAGAHTAHLVFTTRLPQRAALEGFLAANGFGAPQTRSVFGRTDPRHVWRQPWAQRMIARPPRGAEAFPFAEQSAEERRAAEADLAAGHLPAFVDPYWNAEERVEELSLGLRHKGRIVGWMICHTIAQMPGVVRYSRVFCAKSPAASSGNGPWLIAAALDRHVRGKVFATHGTALFDVAATNGPMLALYERRLAPHLDETYRSCVVARPIASVQANRH